MKRNVFYSKKRNRWIGKVNNRSREFLTVYEAQNWVIAQQRREVQNESKSKTR